MVILKYLFLVIVLLFPLTFFAEYQMPLGEKAATKILVQNSGNALALYSLGKSELKKRQCANAMTLFSLAEKNGFPKNRLAADKARALIKLGLPQRALTLLNGVLKKHKKSGYLLSLKAQALYALGDFEDAAQAALQALPLTKRPYRGFLYNLAAKSARSLGDMFRAGLLFRAALRYKKDTWTLYEYAKYLEQAGFLGFSLFQIQRAVALCQRNDFLYPVLQKKRGRLLYAMGERFGKRGLKNLARYYWTILITAPDLRKLRWAEKARFELLLL